IVNLNDYCSYPKSQKDSTEDFKQALRGCNVHVHMTSGTYKATGIKLPNNTVLSGEGKDITTIKFADETPAENIVITNEDMSGNGHNIGIKDFTVNGNKWRQNKKFNAAGGSYLPMLGLLVLNMAVQTTLNQLMHYYMVLILLSLVMITSIKVME